MGALDFLLNRTQYFSPEEVADLMNTAEHSNRKKMKKVIADIEKQYKEDIKAMENRNRLLIAEARTEIEEEVRNYVTGTLHTVYIGALMKKKLCEKTVSKIVDMVAGTLNDLDAGKITVEDLKDFMENEYGFQVVFGTNRKIIGLNIFEERVKVSENAEVGKEKKRKRK